MPQPAKAIVHEGMKIWVIKTSEMLATDNGNGRLLRSGLIAHLLDARGHDVTWWMSTFDHANRRQRSDHDMTERFGRSGTIRLLHSPGYRAVVSPARLWDHAVWGWRFARAIRSLAPPDLIFCAYPTLESAWVSVRCGRRHGLPVVLDLRDMWPDIIAAAVPAPLAGIGRIALTPLFSMARGALRGATALFGITEEFVEWGLRYAARPRNELDCAFPLAYPRNDLADDGSPSQADGGGKMWDDLGVERGQGFNVVLLGSLNGRRYEMEAVIEAARSLKHERPAVRLLICGDGENLARYRQLAADCPNVIFTGWITAAQIRSLLPRVHLGLVPYRNTPDFMMSVPNKAVEYFSAGIPVATSLRGTLARVLTEHDCGVQFDAARPATLVDHIRRLRASRPLHAAMSQRASELFQREFVAEEVYGRLIDRLEIIAARGAGERGAASGLAPPSARPVHTSP